MKLRISKHFLSNLFLVLLGATVFSSALAQGLSVAAVKRAKQRTSVTRGLELGWDSTPL